MASPTFTDTLRSTLAGLDPRRSLGAAAMWLIVALAVAFASAAAIWVGGIARKNVVEQNVRRLSLEADQLSSELGQALAVRLDAVRAAGAMTRAAGKDPRDLGAVFEQLTADYPDLAWIAAADARGVIVSSRDPLQLGTVVKAAPWFSSGSQGPWLGIVDPGSHSSPASEGIAHLGDLAVPFGDSSSPRSGVIASHLRWRRAAHHPERLSDEADPRTATVVYVIDKTGAVLVGPQEMVGKRWTGVPASDAPDTRQMVAGVHGDDSPQFEILPDGRRALIARSALSASDAVSALGWRVQLGEPNERVFQRADALTLQILWVSLCLGVVTAVLGILGARHLTRRLKRLALSVAQVGHGANSGIEVPTGADEVARLGQAFSTLLGELTLERHELERRVAVRTQEVERLAEESRYAAIVRERLTIARDLHDTLAHSMMAILSEIRFLRRLHNRDPHALTQELARAELIAHEGLQEARKAITQMRSTAVRETGLGPALAETFERFLNQTALTGDFQADAAAARFGDERAETILRMAREGLRNVERHARATHVTLRLETIDDAALQLRIEDNGVGFDPEATPAGHYGIVGLREQADMIGARLDIQSSPNEGTMLRVTLHLSPVAFNDQDAAKPQ